MSIWLAVSDHPLARSVLRYYQDRDLVREILKEWGIMGPFAFILVQAAQVLIAPIPGEVTGLLGGFVFGEWLGFAYSVIGLTLGSLLTFWAGRRFGEPLVRRFVSPQTWERLGFIIETDGAMLCFVIYLIPGLPKDTACYLFGVSPIPFWTFATLSTLGRIPGTWALSAQGAKAANDQYAALILLSVIVVAVAVPLYHYRHGLMEWLRRPAS